MPKKIYVGNLPFKTTEQDVRGFLHKNERHLRGAELTNVSKLCHDTALAVFVVEGGMPDTFVAAINGQQLQGNQIVATSDLRGVVERKEDWTWV